MGYSLQEKHPALFIEMRLGKTLIPIRRSKMYTPRDPLLGLRCLVVAPNSALSSWVDELEEEGETFILPDGSSLERLVTIAGSKAKWVLLNKEAFLSIPEIAEVNWDVIVLDESIFIKNPKAKVTKFFLKNFRDVPHRWILTGRPNPSSDLDFFTQLVFLDGEAFGCTNFWRFKTKYFRKEVYSFDWVPYPRTAGIIRREVARRALVIRRKDVSMDVPKVFEKRKLVLPPALRRAYKLLEKDYVLEYEGKEVSKTVYAPVALQQLRQLCGGSINKEFKWEGKIDEILSLLEGELAGEKVVVWFNYNHEINRVYEALTDCGFNCTIINGKVKVKERLLRQKLFNKGNLQVALVQIAVAKSGVNFSGADTAIYYSPVYGTDPWIQSQDRILAVEKKGPLLLISLLVENTVDEDLYESLIQGDFDSKWTLERIYKLARERSKRK